MFSISNLIYLQLLTKRKEQRRKIFTTVRKSYIQTQTNDMNDRQGSFWIPTEENYLEHEICRAKRADRAKKAIFMAVFFSLGARG